VTVYLFVGPTLPAAAAEAGADFVCLPPAAQGDVYRAARLRPRAIGIVDGYFDGVAAVWHKEILWAMGQGIHVFGSASMGALRAAELHEFGVRGVGRIFAAYRAGEWEDDDEVAVLHGPLETGYVALSEALANIRATLDEARQAGIIAEATRRELVRLAKERFYQERTWEHVFADAAAGVSADELRRLRDWLPVGRIDQKRRDALEMIAAMREFLAADPPPMEPAFSFEWTDMWDMALPAMAARGLTPGDGIDDGRVLDELRLDPAAFAATRQRALLRRLARQGGGSSAGPALRRDAERRLRLRLGLPRRVDVERWCHEQGLDPAGFDRLVEAEALLAEAESRFDVDPSRDLLDQMRLDGIYARCLARARDKSRALAAVGAEEATPAALGLTPIALVAWHFETRQRQPVPDDLAGYVRRLGLVHAPDFYRLLTREWIYCRQGKVEADRE
jgi:hypothetical protein